MIQNNITKLFAAITLLGGMTCLRPASRAADLSDQSTAPSQLPLVEIQQIVQAKGTVENGVLDLEISRDDIGEVKGPVGVTFDSDFEINGDLFFQPLSDNKGFLNGDLPLKEEEVNPFISQLLSHDLVFQAFHQHTPMHPQVWFVHFRGAGDPLQLARSIKAALNVTSVPFPQQPPDHPHSSIDPAKIKEILHADSVSVGREGVITAWIYRKDTIVIDGVTVNPQTNISTNVQFKPLDSGTQAAVVPDFSMTAEETVPVITLMLNESGWFQGCLYNQETHEEPQLYFDHMVKTGDAYNLAKEIRRGLDLTDSE